MEGFVQYIVSGESRTILIVCTLIFNLGGFFWIAKNHFHTVNKKLDKVEATLDTLSDRMTDVSMRLGHIEGRCETVCKVAMQNLGLK